MIEVASSQDPYIQEQIGARARPAVIKTKLLTFRSRYPDGLLLAVEGNDDKVVYSSWLSKARPDLSYEFFVCGGKRSARQLRNLLVSDKGEAVKSLLFFVDRDFDDLSGFVATELVFMLERYSIENYLVGHDVLDACLKIAYPGHGDPATRQAICQIFADDYQAFLRSTAVLNERIYLGRQLCFDIDELIPNSVAGFVRIELMNVAPVDKPLSEIIPFPSAIDMEILLALKDQFSELDPMFRYRGKFALNFFRIWLERLSFEFRNPAKGIFPLADRDNGKIKHDEFSLGQLAAKSQIPDGLAEFLRVSGY